MRLVFRTRPLRSKFVRFAQVLSDASSALRPPGGHCRPVDASAAVDWRDSVSSWLERRCWHTSSIAAREVIMNGFHDEVHTDGPGVVLPDLGSRNGKHVNGLRPREEAVAPPDGAVSEVICERLDRERPDVSPEGQASRPDVSPEGGASPPDVGFADS